MINSSFGVITQHVAFVGRLFGSIFWVDDYGGTLLGWAF
jgi:hypothetical protein